MTMKKVSDEPKAKENWLSRAAFSTGDYMDSPGYSKEGHK